MSQSLNDTLAAFFRAHQGQWIDGKELARIAGGYAWRSRCSDLRTQRGMTIENRVRRLTSADGQPYAVSEYRFVASEPVTATGHDLNQAPVGRLV